jgi:OTU domain-containing protein 5
MLDAQLTSLGFITQDVDGDGNCLFRAVSYAISGSESGHKSLRASAASFIESSGSILGGLLHTSPDDNSSFTAHLANLRSLGNSVGEDAIIALAEVTQREIHVYAAYVNPLIYRPTNLKCDQEPVRIAFYEPGHYKAVLHSQQEHSVTGLRLSENF